MDSVDIKLVGAAVVIGLFLLGMITEALSDINRTLKDIAATLKRD